PARADRDPRRRPPRQRRPSQRSVPRRYRPPTAKPGDAMTRDDITAVLVDELGRIAPEIDATGLDPDADLREELDVDSIDFLNLLTPWAEGFKSAFPRTANRTSLNLGTAAATLARGPVISWRWDWRFRLLENNEKA